jgi:hypothetical protein
MVMMDACGSSSNNRAMSSTRNDAEIIAARTSGHRYGAGSTSPSASDSGSRLGPDGGIHAYRWWPEHNACKHSRFMVRSFERGGRSTGRWDER